MMMWFRGQVTLGMLLLLPGLTDSRTALTAAIEFRTEMSVAHDLHTFIIIYSLLVFENFKFLF